MRMIKNYLRVTYFLLALFALMFGIEYSADASDEPFEAARARFSPLSETLAGPDDLMSLSLIHI